MRVIAITMALWEAGVETLAPCHSGASKTDQVAIVYHRIKYQMRRKWVEGHRISRFQLIIIATNGSRQLPAVTLRVTYDNG